MIRHVRLHGEDKTAGRSATPPRHAHLGTVPEERGSRDSDAFINADGPHSRQSPFKTTYKCTEINEHNRLNDSVDKQSQQNAHTADFVNYNGRNTQCDTFGVDGGVLSDSPSRSPQRHALKRTQLHARRYVAANSTIYGKSEDTLNKNSLIRIACFTSSYITLKTNLTIFFSSP